MTALGTDVFWVGFAFGAVVEIGVVLLAMFAVAVDRNGRRR